MSSRNVSADLEVLVRAACLLEATAPKIGNVTPRHSFADLTHVDFVRSAKVIAPILGRDGSPEVGRRCLDSIRATRSEVGRNTNLGMVLLLAPLAVVSKECSLTEGISDVLRLLSVEDTRHGYEAIRIAHPGGLGRVDEQDVAVEPTETLKQVMCRAAGRDLIARQYATDFAIVLNEGRAYLEAYETFADDWPTAILGLQLFLMSRHPDSLIARKCGIDTAIRAMRRAAIVLESGWPSTRIGDAELREFDCWLREDGNRRNPGAIADLIAAIVFAICRDTAFGHSNWNGLGTDPISTLSRIADSIEASTLLFHKDAPGSSSERFGAE